MVCNLVLLLPVLEWYSLSLLGGGLVVCGAAAKAFPVFILLTIIKGIYDKGS